MTYKMSHVAAIVVNTVSTSVQEMPEKNIFSFAEVVYTIPLLHFQSDGRATNSLKCVRYRALHLRIL